MNKISFIPQMRGFMAKMQEDRLPGNAVKLYMCLFDVFNKTCWKKEWVRISIDQLRVSFGRNSNSLIYNNRQLLEDSGYIEVQSGWDPHQRYTEFRLVKLYNDNNAQPDTEPALHSHEEPEGLSQLLNKDATKLQSGQPAPPSAKAASDIPSTGTMPPSQNSRVPYTGTASGTLNGTTPPPPDNRVPYTGTASGTLSGTTPPPPDNRVPYTGTASGTVDGTPNGTTTPSEPLSHKASQPPKKKEEEKEVPRSQSIPDTVGIHSNDYQESFQVFAICMGREATVEEKLQLIKLAQKYSKDALDCALMSMAEQNEPYSQSQCQRYIQRQIYSLAPVSRRREPVPGWPGFRPA